ncbi:hypothetical protein BKA62DRAFT_676959 [Auriculariales sp. MPI-PUGE-AT-0066]|nr:hypothetical protein BKA62DRAFT_676959 [Auriculariales sp. MPI-PUGE-AT-0066]
MSIFACLYRLETCIVRVFCMLFILNVYMGMTVYRSEKFSARPRVNRGGYYRGMPGCPLLGRCDASDRLFWEDHRVSTTQTVWFGQRDAADAVDALALRRPPTLHNSVTCIRGTGVEARLSVYDPVDATGRTRWTQPHSPLPLATRSSPPSLLDSRNACTRRVGWRCRGYCRLFCNAVSFAVATAPLLLAPFRLDDATHFASVVAAAKRSSPPARLDGAK